MEATVLVAIIGGLCVGIPNIIATLFTNNKNTSLMNYKIDELTKKVDKHNQLIERTYKLEELAKVQEEKIRGLNQRITDIE